jgi:hypothetical protein
MGLSQVFYYRGFAELFFEMISEGANSGAQPELLAPDQFLGLSVSSLLIQLVTPVQWAARVYISAAIFASGPRMLLGERVTLGEFLRPGFVRTLWVGVIAFVVALLTNVGLVFLIVPGIIAAVTLSVAEVVSVVEEVTLPEALRRSWNLTQNNWWRIIGFWMIIATLAFALQATIYTPAVLRQLVASINDPNAVFMPVSPAWKVAEGVLAALATALIYPFAEFGWFSMYLDLRARREGMDIVARAQDITQDRP